MTPSEFFAPMDDADTLYRELCEMRTPLSEISSTGEIEQSFRLD